MDFDIGHSFPITQGFKKEEAQEIFWKCLYTGTTQENYHYWVVLPNYVKPVELVPIEFKDVGLINIGRYISQGDFPYMEVWIAYENALWEMNPSDWLYNKLSLMGENILHQRIISHPSGAGRFADVLTYKRLASGEQVISRFTVQKDYNPVKGGGNYFLLKVSCAEKDYEKNANIMHFTAVNWDLSFRSNLMLAELLTSISLGADSGISFKIPDSWNSKVIAENRLVVEHTFNDINHGVINLCFFSKVAYPSPEHVYMLTTSRFNKHDNAVALSADGPKNIVNDMNERLDDVLFEWNGEIISAAENVRALYKAYVFGCDDVWCYAEMVGPHMNHKDYYFEANIRCLEIILATFDKERGAIEN
ncbi:hypothetical protein QL217_16955 [Cronobacter malonaticus]|uniref:hypothetical protein n=1 Tax=Cronobacter malonaticus TaxID=413503 RepID=UPI000518ED46|nr:hypothetical protein [Cronobacter malonaticus]EGT4385597.1 hypothetical protein [Cronobacter malonaticus]EGT4422983.1 hypothetical protein [Cronobacter malonaticus]EGT4447350.1 hypothetical protein [Cronobacter malonaticus]EGT4456207.1 hypothetical protein [Cronobacter malonaticus]ELY2514581.1 hypothetical protein [Cronobacter malonaticus]